MRSWLRRKGDIEILPHHRRIESLLRQSGWRILDVLLKIEDAQRLWICIASLNAKARAIIMILAR